MPLWAIILGVIATIAVLILLNGLACANARRNGDRRWQAQSRADEQARREQADGDRFFAATSQIDGVPMGDFPNVPRVEAPGADFPAHLDRGQ